MIKIKEEIGNWEMFEFSDSVSNDVRSLYDWLCYKISFVLFNITSFKTVGSPTLEN